MREIGAGVLDLLYPPRCLTCGALADSFCPRCRAQIHPVDALDPRVPPIPPGLTDVRSVGYHEGPLRAAVLRLKFEQKVALAAALGELLARELERVKPLWLPDALTPVPIHGSRRWDRGFNQAELLAAEVLSRSGVPLRAALKRVRQTPPQVGQTREQRAENLRGAFIIDPRVPVAGARMVLVDDVRTTGATLAECAAVLRAAGAAEVFGLTVTCVP
jgi:ComF family protein